MTISKPLLRNQYRFFHKLTKVLHNFFIITPKMGHPWLFLTKSTSMSNKNIKVMQPLRKLALFPILFVCLLCITNSIHAANQTTVKNYRIWESPDKIRVVFDLNQATTYKIFTLNHPNRIVLDLKQAKRVAWSKKKPMPNAIQKIRTGIRNKKDLRIVLDLTQPLQAKSYLLKPHQPYGYRLVVDLKSLTKKNTTTAYTLPSSPAQRAKQTKAKAEQPKISIKKAVVVAIDAGHGGEDPGALGPSGTKEKDIVLAIAKKIANQLTATTNIKPALIRSGDYYVELQQRRQIARQKHNADLFISIHADAWIKPQARGASVFVLSKKGASSALASYFADAANGSDLIAGVPLEVEDEMVRSVIADLAMEGSLSHSRQVANNVLQQMGNIVTLHKHHIEHAGFSVLKSPDIPSILIETGFISNPTEEKRLLQSHYQQRLAKAITAGIVQYFTTHPPKGMAVAKVNHKTTFFNQVQTHIIKKGETLSEIAVKYNTPLSVIKQMNHLNSDRIKIGQTLSIPQS